MKFSKWKWDVFPYYHQPDSKDCGPTCLRMLAKYYGKYYNLESLRRLSRINKEGVSMLGITEAANKLGFQTLSAKLDLETLLQEAPFPCIAHWDNNHFVVIYGVKKNKLLIADPAIGKMSLSHEEFSERWHTAEGGGKNEGLVMLLEPGEEFYNATEDKKESLGLNLILQYLRHHRKLIFQLFLGIIAVSALQVVFPFLTKSIVDVGISGKDISFIYLLLAGQLMLLVSRTSIELIRSWILLHISTRINLSLVSDFFIKLMRLPLSYFDSKMTGDILQRINDQRRIEQFLTGSTMNFFFSFLTLIVFSAMLVAYDTQIFFVFLLSAALYAGWIFFFMRYRKILDYRKFEINAKTSNSVIQMITGMQEIKLNNSERPKRWEWERLQSKLFKTNTRSLAVEQYQQIGAFFINEGKNIIITIIAAKHVIDGSISLGTMLAIQYIIGQLNSPIEQFVQFIKSYQDASISLDRINEIHNQEDEEPDSKETFAILDDDKDIFINDITFRYPGAGNQPVINNFSLHIPYGKVTAIVGMSGSGKTTLLKLLLKFHQPESGDISVGDTDLDSINNRFWREQCGVVMQEGFIFSDTIAGNIAVGVEKPDPDRLSYAIRIANIGDFISSLPHGLHTRIGPEGNGISQGQKQRILIARAVYKNPQFLFFDEATNSLDANNERTIMENLEQFYQGKTVIIVAHRLSTVKHADQIVVLHKGQIVETGNHEFLTRQKNHYYELVKNQLELGN
jgi:ATP-binding cassette, subfamily B, bacterial